MRTTTLEILLRAAWRQARSEDPQAHSTLELIQAGPDQLNAEIDRLANRAVACHLALRAEARAQEGLAQ